MLHSGVTDRVLRACYDVYNELGYGFLEKVYENSLAIALRRDGFEVQQQAPISVRFAGEIVGEYFADLVVANLVIVEIKAIERLAAPHDAQLLNYLKATDHEVGLLLNFGPEPEFKRKVMTNQPSDPR